TMMFGQQPLRLEVGKRLPVQPAHMARRYRVKQFADLVVTRNLADAKETLSVIPPLAHLHFALISQKRGRLREKHAKGTQAGIAHRVKLVITSLALVRKLLRIRPQPGHKPLEHGTPPTSDPRS